VVTDRKFVPTENLMALLWQDLPGRELHRFAICVVRDILSYTSKKEYELKKYKLLKHVQEA
jgi:hypothetical protein